MSTELLENSPQFHLIGPSSAGGGKMIFNANEFQILLWTEYGALWTLQWHLESWQLFIDFTGEVEQIV